MSDKNELETKAETKETTGRMSDKNDFETKAELKEMRSVEYDLEVKAETQKLKEILCQCEKVVFNEYSEIKELAEEIKKRILWVEDVENLDLVENAYLHVAVYELFYYQCKTIEKRGYNQTNILYNRVICEGVEKYDMKNLKPFDIADIVKYVTPLDGLYPHFKDKVILNIDQATIKPESEIESYDIEREIHKFNEVQLQNVCKVTMEGIPEKYKPYIKLPKEMQLELFYTSTVSMSCILYSEEINPVTKSNLSMKFQQSFFTPQITWYSKLLKLVPDTQKKVSIIDNPHIRLKPKKVKRIGKPKKVKQNGKPKKVTHIGKPKQFKHIEKPKKAKRIGKPKNVKRIGVYQTIQPSMRINDILDNFNHVFDHINLLKAHIKPLKAPLNN